MCAWNNKSTFRERTRGHWKNDATLHNSSVSLIVLTRNVLSNQLFDTNINILHTKCAHQDVPQTIMWDVCGALPVKIRSTHLHVTWVKTSSAKTVLRPSDGLSRIYSSPTQTCGSTRTSLRCAEDHKEITKSWKNTVKMYLANNTDWHAENAYAEMQRKKSGKPTKQL